METTYNIPQGHEAMIEGDKVIIRPKESEDERVRKAIIELIKQSSNILCPQTQDKMLAYLEKQKEFVSEDFEIIWETEDCKTLLDEGEKLSPRFKELFKEVCHSWYDKGIELEKQKEQKPADLSELMVHKEPYIAPVPTPMVADDQKPSEWSEEDEENFKWFDKFFRAESIVIGGRDIPQDKYLWFKTLRPSSKAKLTLLDENIINAAVAFVEQNDHFNCWGGIDKHTVIKALRSLKPHWKPSEEQMEAILWEIQNTSEGSWQRREMESLLQDLKKL